MVVEQRKFNLIKTSKLEMKIFGVVFLIISSFFWPSYAFAASIISNVVAYEPSYKSVTILWKTDTLSDSDVDYGTSVNYDSAWPTQSSLQTSHNVTLDYLLPNTLYHFRVKSKDSNGDRTVSGDYTFTTLAAPQGLSNSQTGTIFATQKPAISNVNVTSVTSTEAKINWETDQGSDSMVFFGPDVNYTNASNHDYTSTLVHSIKLTGLTAGTTYHFKVRSINQSGLHSDSADSELTTADNLAVTVPITAVPADPIVEPKPASEIIVFPYNIREMDTVKFKNHPAIYIVKLSGLYPFATYSDYLAYKKKSGKVLKIFPGNGSQYTLRTGAARW